MSTNSARKSKGVTLDRLGTRDTHSSRSATSCSLLNIILLIPIVLLFFFCGVYVGSQLLGNSEGESGGIASGATADGLRGLMQNPLADTSQPVQGLPGTKNVYKRWNNLRGGLNRMEEKVGQLLHLPPMGEHKESNSFLDAHHGVDRPIMKFGESKEVSGGGGEVLGATNSAKELSALHPEGLKQPPNVPIPMSGNVAHLSNHPVSGSELAPLLQSSLHATKLSSMKASNQLDSSDIIIGAWVYLDDMVGQEFDMRTIFTNKKSGCENKPDQYGISMYVNGWQTNDHKLYVEYGGTVSGCHKIDSNGIQLHHEHWYHVAVHLSETQSTLYIDGTPVNSISGQNMKPHSVQTSRPLIVGLYGEDFPFYGNISHLAVIHYSSDMIAPDSVVKSMMDIKNIKHTPGLFALYPMIDASFRKDKSQAAEVIGNRNGEYTFPAFGTVTPGVKIVLIDGVGENRVVTSDMKAASDKLARERREKIKEGMKHAWNGYKKFAWGRDELKPLSHAGHDPWGGMGVTLVDSLDTLWLMDMKQEFKEARDWVESSLSFNNAGSVSVFETTIRELGGLLAAYDLSKDAVFLDKARKLGDLLAPAFNTKTGIPRGMVNFHTHTAVGGWAGNSAILSELGTLQVEFRYLAEKTQRQTYETMSMRPLQLMSKMHPDHGLFPIKVSIEDGGFAESQITLGALGDSFYEYLLKIWLQGGKKETWLRDMYDRAIDGVMHLLLKSSSPSGLAFLADYNNGRVHRKMDHLVCFMPGILALGAYNDPTGVNSARAKRDLAVAKALMYTCREMYHRMASGISPEYVEFPEGQDMVVGMSAPFYILRPETAESLFVLNKLTGDPIYRDWAWEIWEAIDKRCKTDVAYGSLHDVNTVHGGVEDRMESFFLAETIKYLYLAQDPDTTIDLTKVVFNTEAHPLSILSESHEPITTTIH